MSATNKFIDFITSDYKGDVVWEARLISAEGTVKPHFLSSVENVKKFFEKNFDKLNGKYNIYLGVLPRKERGGREEDVAFGNTYFVDLDSIKSREHIKEIRKKLIGMDFAPSLVVASSDKKVQIYFKSVNQETPEDWRIIQKALNDLFQAEFGEYAPDKAPIDPPRIMRVPGFLNMKYKPTQQTAILHEDYTMYSTKALKKLLKPHIRKQTAKEKGEAGESRKAIGVIPESIDALIRNGAPEGERHKSVWIIVKEMFNRKFDRKTILENALKFNSNCKLPKSEGIIEKQVKNLLANPGRYLAEYHPEALEKKARTIPFDDMLKKKMPKIEFWLEGLIPKSSILLIGGRPNSFKSMFVLSMCLATTQGKIFLDYFYPKGKPKILLYDLENGERITIRRSKYLIGKSMKGLENLHYAENFNKQDIPGELDLAQNYDIIILDSYRRFLHGEENASEVTDRFYSQFLKPLREQGKTIIIVHHFRKMRQNEELTEDYMLELFRGSSDIVAQVDTAYAIFKTDEEYDREKKQRTLKIAVNVAKNRLGLPLQRFGIDVLQDDNTEKTTLGWIAIKKQLPPHMERMRLIREFIGDRMCTRPQILAYILEVTPNISIRTIDTALKDMVILGQIKKEGRGSYSKV